MKKLLLLILSLVLVFAFVSCDGGTVCTEHKDADKDGKCDECQATVDNGECEHGDADEDGKCDECGEDMGGKVDDSNPLALIENGEARFQIVASKMCGTKISKAINDFIKDMGKLGVEITFVNDDKEENIVDCEILVGDVSSRGEKYDYDEHTLGIKGSAVTRIDNKIIITAGSTDYTVDAFENFCKDVIGLTKNADADTVANVSFEKKQESLKVQSDYRITAIKIGETEIEGYTIALDQANAYHLEAATLLQKTFYERAGYWLPMVSLAEAGEKSIIIKSVPKGTSSPAGKEGFLIRTENGKMEILCAYDNMLVETMNSVTAKIIVTQGEYVFNDNSEVLKKNISVIYYKDWDDIKGDGVTDDFDAIRALHEYANISGQRVVCENGKEYYLKNGGGKPIVIKTDVDFGTAKFIIDDTFIDTSSASNVERNMSVFSVESDYENIDFGANSDIAKLINENGGVRTTDATLPLNLGYDALVKLTNADRRVYHRWGNGTTGAGVIQEEIIIVRKDNSIDSSTKLLFDFEKVTNVCVMRLDVTPITLSGGIFTTHAASYGVDSGLYTTRSMSIKRNNTTITNLEHRVVEEETKVYYNGFINIRDASNILVKDTKLSGRGGTGTYDISINWGNDVTFLRCTQYNMFDENGKVYNEMIYWGIMGSNYSKNINYDSCVLSRFDAHAGVYNFSIKNCNIAQINITGGGLGVVENCTVYRNRTFVLREDYGTYWMGDIVVKNVKMVQDSGDFSVFHGNVHDVDVHDPELGFKTQLPNLYLENLTLEDYSGNKRSDADVKIFNLTFDRSLYTTGRGEHNEILPAAKITIKQPEGAAKITSVGDETLEWKFCTTPVEYLSSEEE